MALTEKDKVELLELMQGAKSAEQSNTHKQDSYLVTRLRKYGMPLAMLATGFSLYAGYEKWAKDNYETPALEKLTLNTRVDNNFIAIQGNTTGVLNNKNNIQENKESIAATDTQLVAYISPTLTTMVKNINQINSGIEVMKQQLSSEIQEATIQRGDHANRILKLEFFKDDQREQR